MARARILPHSEVAADSVTWGDWWVRINGERRLAGKRVDGWDYATPITFELQPTVDVDHALASSGLVSLDPVDLVLLVESPSTGRRFTASQSLLTLVESSGVLAIQPPPDQIARSVTVSACLILGRTTPITGDDAAWKHGSRLAHSTRETIWLEGDAPRFPTEAVAFSGLGLEAALWDLDVSFTDLDESFLSNVRLLLNTDHAAADTLLDPSHPAFPNARSMLEMDIARRLFQQVANDEGLRGDVSRRIWPEGSVREVLEGISDVVLGSSLTAIVELAHSDPRRFERKLQSRFDLFRVHG